MRGDLFARRLPRLELAGGALVGHLPLARRDVAVDGVAHQGVHEAERVCVAQHLGARQQGDRRRDLALGQVGESGDGRQLGGVAEHRDGAGDRRAVPRELGQAHQDHARHGARPDGGDRVGVRGVGSHAVALQGAQQLAQQQRVAVRRAVACGNEGVVARLAEPLPHEVGHRFDVEGLRPHLHRGEVVDQLGQQPVHVVPLTRAQGRREQHGQALEPAQQVGEEPQRAGVAPLQVVDGEQQRTVGGQVDRQPVEAVQHREGAVGTLVCCVGVRVEHTGGRRCGTGEQRGTSRGVGEGGFEQLADRPEAELALHLAAARVERRHAVLGRHPLRLAEQAALPDAGRPFDQGEPALPRPGLLEAVAQLGQLAVPPDERVDRG